MRSGEVAEAAGVNLQTLRYYERRGLLAAPPRRASGYREYPPKAVRVIRFIRRTQALGFGLAEVAQLLELAEGGGRDPEVVRARATAMLDEVGRRLSDLEALRDALQRFAETCREVWPEGCPLLDLATDTREQG